VNLPRPPICDEDAIAHFSISRSDVKPLMGETVDRPKKDVRFTQCCGCRSSVSCYRECRPTTGGGASSQSLYELARGIDRSPVVPNRVSKSVSAEDTFPTDLPLPELQPAIHRLAEKVWNASRGNARQARTIVLKLKTREFTTLTRSLTPTEMPRSADQLAELAMSLFDRVDLGPSQLLQLFRLAGVGLSNFQIEAELPLLGSNPATESIIEEFTPVVEQMGCD